MMELALLIIGLVMSLVGAHVIANTAYARLLKSRKKWVATTVSYILLLTSFAAIGGVMMTIFSHAVPFSR